MAKIIRGNHNGPKGGNYSYSIPGREYDVPRATLVREVEKGKHPNRAIYELDGENYGRADAGSRIGNNVNAER
jgi:hypothetical protein